MRGANPGRTCEATLSFAALLLLAAAPPHNTKPLADLQALGRTYRIEVVTADPRFPVKTAHGKIDGKRAGDRALARYAGLFVAEFSLYPSALVKRTKLRRVVLCEKLTFAGQPRTAIPDFENDTLYLDVSRGGHSRRYQRAVIHHEFFHLIDYRDDGQLYADERWQALNPPRFRYGSGGRNAQDLKTASVLTDKYPGFLTHYATTAVEEDKAEVFAHLIVSPAHVEERAAKDRALKAKVKRMKELLAAFCPEVKEEFWEKASKAREGR